MSFELSGRCPVSKRRRPHNEDLQPPLTALADKVVAGALNDFDRVGRIISYLNAQTNLVQFNPGDLASAATLEQFLFEGTTPSTKTRSQGI